MEDIYIILSKHFLYETSEEEELKVQGFKNDNPREYKILLELWNREGIVIHDFDSRKAWKKFKITQQTKSGKIIPFYFKIRNIAAVIAFIFISTLATIYLINRLKPATVYVQNSEAESAKRIELNDGSIVWLNRNSSFSYPRRFTNETREVELEGEAFFEVVTDAKRPFSVFTKNSKITVLGTSFNINSSASNTEVTVKTGKVRVTSDYTDDYIILKTNQTAIVTKNKLIAFENHNPNYLSWKTGVFEFNDVPILQVINDLNTFYNNRIEIDTSKVYNCNLSAKFNKTPIEDIIEIIQTTCGFNIQMINDKYYINN